MVVRLGEQHLSTPSKSLIDLVWNAHYRLGSQQIQRSPEHTDSETAVEILEHFTNLSSRKPRSSISNINGTRTTKQEQGQQLPQAAARTKTNAAAAISDETTVVSFWNVWTFAFAVLSFSILWLFIKLKCFYICMWACPIFIFHIIPLHLFLPHPCNNWLYY